MLPISAWYILTIAEHNFNTTTEVNNSTETLSLIELKNHYQHILQQLNMSSADNFLLKHSLENYVRQFFFMGDDLTALTNFIIEHYQEKTNAFAIDSSSHLFQKIQTAFKKESLKVQKFLLPDIPNLTLYLKQLALYLHQWHKKREQFANENIGLVHLLQQAYQGQVLDKDDLYQEGMIGLLKAIDRFNPELGFKFSTYAAYWIRQSISRALTRNERVVRLPFEQMTLLNKIRQAREMLETELGYEPTTEQLAKHLQLSKDKIEDLHSISQISLSLDAAFDGQESEFNLSQCLEQSCHLSPNTEYTKQELQNLLIQALSVLNSKEKQIICSRFGLLSHTELTLDELGKQLKLTRERVRQIQVSAMEKIKKYYGQQLQHFLT